MTKPDLDAFTAVKQLIFEAFRLYGNSTRRTFWKFLVPHTMVFLHQLVIDDTNSENKRMNIGDIYMISTSDMF